MRALYLCYFGIAEPLVQSQVLPYLRELTRGGTEMHLLTFEPVQGDAWREPQATAWRHALQQDGIHWNWLRYHKRPTLPATAYDIVRGAWFTWRLDRQSRFDVVHARSHVPAVMGALVKRLTGARLIFDVRGLLLEEYVDAGVWPAGGFIYRVAKRAERALVRTADGFVILASPARPALFGSSAVEQDAESRPIEVIPCCVDTRRFASASAQTRDEAKARLGLAGCRVFVHVGVVDGWVATETLAEIIAAAHRRDSNTRAIFLTHSKTNRLERALRERGVQAGAYLIRGVAPEDVPAYIGASDVGLAAFLPSISKLASSPTKVAEYLATGIPVICTDGAGDVDSLLEDHRVGVVLRGRDRNACEDALTRLDVLLSDPELPARCRKTAIAEFDLERVGGPAYRRLYERVLARPS